MGMVAYYLEVTPEQLNAIRESPRSVQSLIRTFSGRHDAIPRPPIVEPAVSLWPALIVAALFVLIWLWWGRSIGNPGWRRVFAWALSLAAIASLFGTYHVQANRQRESFQVLKSLEGSRPLDVDKNWHIVHFLLTGSAQAGDKPLFNVVLGGQESGSDLGYGPARFLTPKEVQEVADAVGPLRKGNLRLRFTPKDLMKADLYTWDEDDGQERLDGDLETYEEIRAYLLEAAKKGNGMLLIIM